jgi:glycosyltransferase involved in cell wall biosynthesis
MKVSIVIPAYNEEKWIEKTLIAALAQDYPDFEIIVVDNASTDKTSEIVQKFVSSHPKIKLVEEKRKGLLYAREAGRLAAKGDIIVQLDADCLPFPEWLSIGMQFFKKQKVVAVSGPYNFYDAPPGIRITTDIAQRYIFYPVRMITNAFGRGTMFVGGNAFIRAKALKKIGGYDTSIDFYSEDADTGVRLAQVGNVIYSTDIMIDSSARRFKAFGLRELNKKYTKAWVTTVLAGKKLEDNKETNHPR